jgi:hypothetical protein
MARLVSLWAILLLFFFCAAASAPPVTLRQAGDRAGILIGAAVRPGQFSEAAYSESLRTR